MSWAIAPPAPATQQGWANQPVSTAGKGWALPGLQNVALDGTGSLSATVNVDGLSAIVATDGLSATVGIDGLSARVS